MITRSRIDRTKNPNVPAVQTYLAEKYEVEYAKATTTKQQQKVKRLYSGIKDEDIFIEYIREPVNISETVIRRFLCCFSVPKLGYAVLDARLLYTTLDELITYFNIPVTTVKTYTDLITTIKAGKKSGLFKVESGSGQYGICIDNQTTVEQRYNALTASLGGIVFNMVVNYTGETFSASNPNIGELALSYPGCDTYSLELYPLEEIVSNNAFDGNIVYNGGLTYAG